MKKKKKCFSRDGQCCFPSDPERKNILGAQILHNRGLRSINDLSAYERSSSLSKTNRILSL